MKIGLLCLSMIVTTAPVLAGNRQQVAELCRYQANSVKCISNFKSLPPIGQANRSTSSKPISLEVINYTYGQKDTKSSKYKNYKKGINNQRGIAIKTKAWGEDEWYDY